MFLDAWQQAAEAGGQQSDSANDLAFATLMADTLVDHVIRTGPHAYWQFIEHRNPEPLLPPRVGWMQGAAGIAAFLFRIARVLRDGPDAAPLGRMETWWALPQPSGRD